MGVSLSWFGAVGTIKVHTTELVSAWFFSVVYGEHVCLKALSMGQCQLIVANCSPGEVTRSRIWIQGE